MRCPYCQNEKHKHDNSSLNDAGIHDICKDKYDDRIEKNLCAYCGINRAMSGLVSCNSCSSTNVPFQGYDDPTIL